MSYSTNDVPSANGGGFNTAVTPPSSHVDHYQGHGRTHSASVSRIPATPQSAHTNGSLQSPLSPDRDDQSRGVQPLQSALQASAAPFGPQLNSPSSVQSTSSTTGSVAPAFTTPFYGYGVQSYVPNPVQTNGQVASFGTQGAFGPYVPSNYSQYGRFPETPARQHRRSGDSESGQISRFSNVPLEQYKGDLYNLCKDQHGCRYLQRKLEEQNPAHVQMIFLETHIHVVELMTGKTQIDFLLVCILSDILSLRSIWKLLVPKVIGILQR